MICNIQAHAQLEEDMGRCPVVLVHGTMQWCVVHVAQAVRFINRNFWLANHIQQRQVLSQLRNGVQTMVSL